MSRSTWPQAAAHMAPTAAASFSRAPAVSVSATWLATESPRETPSGPTALRPPWAYQEFEFSRLSLVSSVTSSPRVAAVSAA